MTVRSDLPWLRRRVIAPPAPPAPKRVEYVHAARTPAVRAPSKVDYTRRTEPTAPSAPPSGGLLDLGPAAAPAPRRAARPDPEPARPQRRARSGPAALLTPDAPTVTLTRLQSGVGVLDLDLVSSLGQVRVAAAYETTDGASSVLVDGGRRAQAGPLHLAHDRYAGLVLDLRRVRTLRRLAVVLLPGGPVDWVGTLVVTTYAGVRVEVPLDLGSGADVAVPLSAYVVDGELVLRAERERVAGSLRDTCLAFGYERITWADDHTPAD